MPRLKWCIDSNSMDSIVTMDGWSLKSTEGHLCGSWRAGIALTVGLLITPFIGQVMILIGQELLLFGLASFILAIIIITIKTPRYADRLARIIAAKKSRDPPDDFTVIRS